MQKVFIDVDVCLDLLSGRKPFNESAERIFSLGDRKQIRLYVSSLSFSNIDYILQSHFKINDARKILSRFKTLVHVLAVDDKTIDLALSSDFKDFEDAIQYHTALNHGIDNIVTRNLKDYKKAKCKIMSPEMLLKIIKDN
jgi:predicted nucleic acid-binding protein